MAYSYSHSKIIRHSGLGKEKVVKGATIYEVEAKASEQMARWEEQWQKQQEKERRNQHLENSLDEAERRTIEAIEANDALIHLLYRYVKGGVKGLDFEAMKSPMIFSENEPQPTPEVGMPLKPYRSNAIYNSSTGILGKIFKSIQEKADRESQARYDADIAAWTNESRRIMKLNEENEIKYKERYNEWSNRKEKHLEEVRLNNESIDKFKNDFGNNDKSAVEEYFSIYLNDVQFGNIDYDRAIYVELREDEKLFLIDYQLPTIEDLPKLKSVSYIKTKDEFKETYYTDAQMKRLYECVIYDILLAVVYTIFSLTKKSAVEAVAFNGFVNTIDRSTGQNISPYIVSVDVSRKPFSELNLKEIDAREWFKSAKGVSAAALANITPIRPIIEMVREDKRFVEGYEVVDNIDDSVNLAAMDWQDFENLIRELFEEEFSKEGGEVKITQASRDGGVDAVAFDPDPIRGGKIVIQAKRYTNVVGVSAVRDLYGTVMNEGAMKGILVTTSNYGNDAYDFAKDKPLTLLNGANLLYLMEKHGHKARIDIKEAKELIVN